MQEGDREGIVYEERMGGKATVGKKWVAEGSVRRV